MEKKGGEKRGDKVRIEEDMREMGKNIKYKIGQKKREGLRGDKGGMGREEGRGDKGGMGREEGRGDKGEPETTFGVYPDI
ncbi:hypothetical protein Pcinc_032866 [Petrolisthes cinctipes]|uniref:Uncharacterized protein n=1 Tax=Petrolisthes cinctipes TaxID=88211 RepID=A0AAE1ET73_PETCI|nr:hypothetical protein Pcinc_032866 [Petrolisthes cinctipes]